MKRTRAARDSEGSATRSRASRGSPSQGAQPLDGGLRDARKFTDDRPRYRFKEQEPHVWSRASGSVAETFRRLRSQLFNSSTKKLTSLVVTSAIPNDGKTFVALNLARAAAEADGLRSVVVEGDLRRPSLGKLIDPTPKQGLGEVVALGVRLESAIATTVGPFPDVVTAGQWNGETTQALSSEQCRAAIQRLRERYDVVIIDTPPIVPFADATLLARYAQGVLLVVRERHTLVGAYQQALDLLRSERLVGVVFNDFQASILDRNHGADEYYRYYRKRIQRSSQENGNP